jgi:uncharacterized protein (TIGR02145 family)
MKKSKQILVVLALGLSTFAFAQVGIGTTTVATDAILELSDANKALLLTRVADVNAIANPVNGMLIYDMSQNCIIGYQNGAWSSCIGGPVSVVSSFDCNTASDGTMTAGTPVSGVTQTITATVTTVGPYSISATANGVTFSANGTYAGTGPQVVVLTATGTPVAAGPSTFTLNTTPSCSFNRTSAINTSVICVGGGATSIIEVTSATGRIWMDRNLGAARVATSSADVDSYGDLYQWGRAGEGHQCRNSTITLIGEPQANTPAPLEGNFWDGQFIQNYADWLTPLDNDLWQEISDVNNPCPTNYRVPTATELNQEMDSWGSSNIAGAFSSALKLPAGGYRNSNNGDVNQDGGTHGYYWSSGNSGAGNGGRGIAFAAAGAGPQNYNKATGHSVRCIKNE